MTALRRATPDDAPALAAILGDWVRDTPWMPKLHTRAQDIAFLSRLIETTKVTIAQGPAGFLSRDGAEIPALYVAAAARGKGIGAALLSRAQTDSPHLALWTFAANTGARRFYARHGFAEIGRSDGDNAEGLPDIRLAWQETRAQ